MTQKKQKKVGRKASTKTSLPARNAAWAKANYQERLRIEKSREAEIAEKKQQDWWVVDIFTNRLYGPLLTNGGARKFAKIARKRAAGEMFLESGTNIFIAKTGSELEKIVGDTEMKIVKALVKNVK